MAFLGTSRVLAPVSALTMYVPFVLWRSCVLSENVTVSETTNIKAVFERHGVALTRSGYSIKKV